MGRIVTFLLLLLCTAVAARAQKMPLDDGEIEKRIGLLESEVAKLKKWKFSGYIQGQYQWGEEAAFLKVGAANGEPGKSFDRFGIRRGRIKFACEAGIASAVFQIDLTEKGVGFKEAYLRLKDPWIGTLAFTGGVFNRPFGYEIGYSSSMRESPERSTVFQTLFPEERDLGAMLILQAPETSPWSIFKLEAGLFAGNGVKMETDNKRDFIGHLSVSGKWGRNVSLGGGVSYYNGKVYQGTQNVYSMQGKEFVLHHSESNKGGFAKREYTGLDLQFAVSSALGTTKLHGEYLFGRQPGFQHKTNSPNASSLPAGDTYLRTFNGGYAMLVHYIGKAPVAVTGKYDWYDPNTRISGDEIGRGGTVEADLRVHTYGVGALWDFKPGMRLSVWYDFNCNENTEIRNDVFTLRLQHKF
ncbi:MAG: hypothetical protein LBR65_06210 [Culturomica sp.]|jgi:phosphate-selective porin|nr:hypothetical protein [Culturomica sp.]